MSRCHRPRSAARCARSGPGVVEDLQGRRSARSRSALRLTPTETDCVAGHVGLELRNVVANYPFESSRGFPRSEPNFGRVDHSRLSCRAGHTQLGERQAPSPASKYAPCRTRASRTRITIARAQREEGLRVRLRERGKTTGQTPFGLLGLANLDTRHKHQSESVWCEAGQVTLPKM
jgi:hypothetical protein